MRSYAHYVYFGLRIVKVVALLVTGILLLGVGGACGDLCPGKVHYGLPRGGWSRRVRTGRRGQVRFLADLGAGVAAEGFLHRFSLSTNNC